ncbi:hypothetical protein ONZ51_g1320 [Trametes cubensis]|uniref:Uncharacterized protein n=1 Tax=Trametes cubensis TaxID=1111947 RepID=A0AAD7U479_9APHY|nr:hypothetical protein ONZ51_g1320 [Trametes cubensis]
MHTYITTSLVGERAGDIFRDIFIRDADGKILIDGPEGKPALDINHPIQKIVMHSRFAAVDGLSVTYQLDTGENLTLNRGFQRPDLYANAIEFGGETPSALTRQATDLVMRYAENERLVGVSGRTGFHPWYRGNVILWLAFVIYDTAKGTTRVVNPVRPLDTPGQGEAEAALAQGAQFYVSDVLALGGFHTQGDGYGSLPGLFFYKNEGAQ